MQSVEPGESAERLIWANYKNRNACVIIPVTLPNKMVELNYIVQRGMVQRRARLKAPCEHE